jgi:hypothetical protein
MRHLFYCLSTLREAAVLSLSEATQIVLRQANGKALTYSVGQVTGTGLILEWTSSSQVIWQLSIVILIEYFVLEADLRLQLSDLLLQLSLGSRFVFARPHHSRTCSCASSHEAHLLRVSHEKRAEVNIALEVSGLFGLELLALHEDVGMLAIGRLAWHPTLDLLWVGWLVPAL